VQPHGARVQAAVPNEGHGPGRRVGHVALDVGEGEEAGLRLAVFVLEGGLAGDRAVVELLAAESPGVLGGEDPRFRYGFRLLLLIFLREAAVRRETENDEQKHDPTLQFHETLPRMDEKPINLPSLSGKAGELTPARTSPG